MTEEAKTFLQWVGSKNRLLYDLSMRLPQRFIDGEPTIYIEPFVGGGSMLFYMLSKYSNIVSVKINDINERLTKTYTVVRDMPDKLLPAIEKLSDRWHSLPVKQRFDMYNEVKGLFNTESMDDVTLAARFWFLNRTCFNGLYRENKEGKFNVSMRNGYNFILDRENFMACSRHLKRVSISTGDYKDCLTEITPSTLVYLDPPYRPISATSNFNSYSSEGFGDKEQLELKEMADKINEAGGHFMLSNSDCPDGFFDRLYSDYVIDKVSIQRCITCLSTKNFVQEIVVRNYRGTLYDRMTKYEQTGLF